LFEAPEIFSNIPEIAQIYAINDKQSEDLESAVDRMDQNIFLSTMDEATIARWENILNFIPLDTDTIEDRRFRVKSKVIEKLPYTERVILRKLDTLCPLGYEMIVNDDRTDVLVKLALKSKNTIEDVDKMMDEMLPLNMTYVVMVMFNNYEAISHFTHEELAVFTHENIKENVFTF
jgi:hypothetical protein